MLQISKPIVLDNVTCPYCGVRLTEKNSNKEHVIGRRFVPRGTLDGKWNLIVRACRTCNGRKADLENDLSAITMQPDPRGKYARDDQILKDEAIRKGQKSISSRTGKATSDSFENIEVTQRLNKKLQTKISFMSSPQADPQRLLDLAHFHIKGFFYFVTYNPHTKMGRFWQGNLFGVAVTVLSDWGNLLNRAFMDTVVTWEPRMIGGSADGFFKIAIRRHPDSETICWSWALEWNAKFRAIGFFGEEKPIRAINATFPKLEMQTIVLGPDEYVGIRMETPITQEDDQLFYWDKFETE